MKIEYTEYALSGNVEALGGNLWNERVGAAIRGKRVDDELQVAARVVFKEILPELQNFMEQKIAHELKSANLQISDLQRTLKMTLPINAKDSCFYCGIGSVPKEGVHFDKDNVWNGDQECLWSARYAEAVKVLGLLRPKVSTNEKTF